MSAPTPEDVTPRRPEPRDLRGQVFDLAADVQGHRDQLGRTIVHVVVAPDLGTYIVTGGLHPVAAELLQGVRLVVSDDQRPGTYLLVLEGPL